MNAIQVKGHSESAAIRLGDVRNEQLEQRRFRLLLFAGMLGLLCVAILLTAPQLGLISGVGGLIAAAGSAGVTSLARRVKA